MSRSDDAVADNRLVAPHQQRMAAPSKGFAATPYDIGCINCNECVWREGKKTPLRICIHDHHKKRPDCRPPPPNAHPSVMVKRLEKDVAAAKSVVANGRTGDGEQFFKRDGISTAYQCGGCTKLFPTKKQAGRHTENVKDCSDSSVAAVECRETIFGTPVLPLPSVRRRTSSMSSPAPTRPSSANGIRAACPPLLGTGNTVATPSVRPPVANPYARRVTPTPFIGTPVSTLRPAAAPSPAIAINSSLAVSRITTNIASGLSRPDLTPRQVAEAKIKPFVQDGHDPFAFTQIYDHLGRPSDVAAKLDSIRALSTKDDDFSHHVLKAAIKEYILYYGRHDVEKLWPNLRALLQSVGPNVDDEEKLDNGTFTYRQEAADLLYQAESLILYLYNNPIYEYKPLQEVVDKAVAAYPGDEIEAAFQVVQSGVIAECFVDILTESPTRIDSCSIIVEYAAYKCFKYTRYKKEYKLYSADTCSKMAAAIHTILRAGACTVLVLNTTSLESNIIQEPSHSVVQLATDFCNNIRRSAPNSRIAGLIRYWKEISARTTIKEPPTTIVRGEMDGNSLITARLNFVAKAAQHRFDMSDR
eukprot:CAMPEP_0178474292 /NCGR_PEP_ID=MMETSP0696-20121128/2527_1 /TAXON_ID=265572 /ORGANISM="Extubocellulus spinifer, Strain CCMP396" /LENGTH=585 /DNA_ID=CAMNT_0020101541 /DNA_START=194 /DNA_END=1947 /DNA_ORIENTATION=-